MALDDVWASRDLPALESIARRIDAGSGSVAPEQVAQDTGLSHDAAVQAMRALVRTGYVERAREARLSSAIEVGNVSDRAYQVTGLHPNGEDAVADLIKLLNEAADMEPDPEQRSNLRKLAGQAGVVGRDVLGNVLGSVIVAAGRGMLG